MSGAPIGDRDAIAEIAADLIADAFGGARADQLAVARAILRVLPPLVFPGDDLVSAAQRALLGRRLGQ